MKKANKKQVNNQQVNNNGCQHVQLGGIAYYDDKQYFLFSPDSVNQGVVEAFRRHGVAQQMQDGTFDFVAVSKPKSQSELIKKLAHGRVSKTKDGAIQLTLKVFFHEAGFVSHHILPYRRTTQGKPLPTAVLPQRLQPMPHTYDNHAYHPE